MDAQRIAANASADDYRRFRESAAEPAAQRHQGGPDDEHINRALAAFGLVREAG